MELLWKAIFNKLADFETRRTDILGYESDDFFTFLKLIKTIENSIPTYESYDGLPDEHNYPLARAFSFFGRAFVEELECYKTDFAKEHRFHPVDAKWGMFKSGAGNPREPDFKDIDNNLYDVKHNKVAADKAHTARYILKYTGDKSTAWFELHDLFKDNGTFTGITFPCRTLTEIANELGINPLLFNVDRLSQAELESQLRKYFGLDN